MRDIAPLSQWQVEQEIMRLSGVLTEICEDVAEAARNEAQTEVAYKVAHAKAWLERRGHKGTNPEKEAGALIDCAGEFEAMKMAEAVYKACAESGRNVRAQLDALRSIAANVRDRVHYPTGTGG